MQSLNAHFLHFCGNRVFPISCQAIHAGTHQKMYA
jgi:hypothetical protein